MHWKQLIVGFILIFSSVGMGLGTFSIQSQGASDSDGVLIINARVVASGTYNIVRVQSSGTLIIETQLETSQLILDAGSNLEITGGTLTILDSDTPGAEVFISGTCNNFKMTQGARIDILGSTGSNVVNQSAGGDVELNITVKSNLVLDNSDIYLTGGSGYSKLTPGADANYDLTAHQYSGGNATAVFKLSQSSTQAFRKSTVNVQGGSGGKASDGESASLTSFGKGGGYTNGGSAGGYVGSGGFAFLKIDYSNTLNFDNMNFSVLGGSGGKSGDGSYLTTEHGGGGGGYTGGDGGQYIAAEPTKTNGKPGGNVSGYVGTGGNANFEISSNSSIDLQDSSIAVHGGTGGDAGPHKSVAMSPFLGGMGGFGYGGGGGGGGYASFISTVTTIGGSGGSVSGNAGSGGTANVLLNARGYLTMVDSFVNLSGGRGGRASNGTPGKTGGGAGGGFGGGGGGGGSLLNTGNVTSLGGDGGNISGYVGTGGDSHLKIISSIDIGLWTSTIYSQGGSGAAAGAGGPVNTIDAGSGGGGYGGGGGGGKNGEWVGGTGGNGGQVSGYVGSGGNATLNFIAAGTLDVMDSTMFGKGGDAGSNGNGGQYTAGIGGGGGGGYGGGGGGGGSALYTGGSGGSGQIESGDAGTGGDIDFIFNAARYSISKDSVLVAFEGGGVSSSNMPGLSGGLQVNGFGAGGSGTGQIGSAGSKELEIPMGIPRLILPDTNQAISYNLPSFTWIPQHNSTLFGSLTGHRLEIDAKPDFTTPVVIAYTQEGSYVLKNPLLDGTYYWRVRAEYSDDSAGWSEVRSLIIDTTPVFFASLTDHSWKNTLAPNCTINIGDILTGVSLTSVQYSYSFTGTFPASFSPWQGAAGIEDISGDGTYISAWAYPEFKAGVNNFIKWRAMDIVGNGFKESQVINVKIDLDPPLVSPFAPSHNSWSFETRPMFRWTGFDIGSGLSGNTSFRVFKYDSNGTVPAIPIFQFNGSVEFNSSGFYDYGLVNDLVYGKYCWDIQIEDGAGLWSVISEKMTFNVDTVSPVVSGLSPANSQWVPEIPTFSWDAVDTFAGVDTKFFLELARDISFQKLVFIVEGDDSDLTTPDGQTFTYEWLTDEPLEAGTWFWRIKVMGNEGLWSDYSIPMEFRVDAQAPYIVPVSPMNGSWSNGGTELTWSAFDSESGLTGKYRIIVAEEREFIKPIIDRVVDSALGASADDTDVTFISSQGGLNTANISYMIKTELYRNVYYWRVEAEDAVGIWSSPSDIFEFKIDLEPPQVTTASPEHGSWVGNSLRFQWTANDPLSGLAGEYHIQVASSSDFNSDSFYINTLFPGPKQNNVLLEYTPDLSLPEIELYWRISAKDNAGNWCPFSPEKSFQLDLTGVRFNPITDSTWFNSKNVSFSIEITDIGSGVDFENIYYRTSTTGIANYRPWQHIQSADLDLITSSKIEGTVSFTSREGFGNYIQFKARDVVNSAYQESPNFMLSVDLSPVSFSEPNPSADSWQERNVVSCSLSIFDLYSGVDTSSIEYRYSIDGLDNFEDWLTYTNSYQRLPSGEIAVQADVVFDEGENNYIQWRVKDNAGNGFFTSEPFKVKVRSTDEKDAGQKNEPKVDRMEDEGWGILTSNGFINLCRVIVIMVVFVFVIGVLRRQRNRKYEDLDDNEPGSKINVFSKLSSKNKKEAPIPDSSPGGRNDTTRFILHKNGSDPDNLEEIMEALDNELQDKFKPKKGFNAPLSNRTVINIPPSSLSRRPVNRQKLRPTGKHDKKDSFNTWCEICGGKFKFGMTWKKCSCGGTYHQSCAQRKGQCPVCKRKLLNQ